MTTLAHHSQVLTTSWSMEAGRRRKNHTRYENYAFLPAAHDMRLLSQQRSQPLMAKVILLHQQQTLQHQPQPLQPIPSHSSHGHQTCPILLPMTKRGQPSTMYLLNRRKNTAICRCSISMPVSGCLRTVARPRSRLVAAAFELPTRNNNTLAIVAARLLRYGETTRAIHSTPTSAMTM